MLREALSSLRQRLEGVTPEEREMQEAMREFREKDAREVEEAVYTLIRSLPPPLQNLEAHWLDQLPEVRRYVRRNVQRSLRSDQGGDVAEACALHGLSPVSIHDAVYRIEWLLRELTRMGDLQSGKEIRISEETQLSENRNLKRMVEGSIGMALKNQEAAIPFYHWLIEVLKIRPFLLKDYCAEVGADGTITLHPLPEGEKDETGEELKDRWTKKAEQPT